MSRYNPFRRKQVHQKRAVGQLSPDANAAFEVVLSQMSRAVVMSGVGEREAWNRLVGRVGREEAIELLETSVIISSTNLFHEAVSRIGAAWTAGELSAHKAVEQINDANEGQFDMLDASGTRVHGYATRPEASEVVDASRHLTRTLVESSKQFVNLTLGESLAQLAQDARYRWDVAEQEYDSASNRPALPLVGGLDTWDN